jgi:hypothetical protein
VTSRLGTGKTIIFFYSVQSGLYILQACTVHTLVSIMEATVPCLEAGRVGKEAGREVAQPVLIEAEGAEDPEAGEGPRMDGGQLVVGQQEGVEVGQLGQRVPAHSGQSESTHFNCNTFISVYDFIPYFPYTKSPQPCDHAHMISDYTVEK